MPVGPSENPKLRNTATQIHRNSATIANAESTVPSQGKRRWDSTHVHFAEGMQ
jgi:hypothetical protein